MDSIIAKQNLPVTSQGLEAEGKNEQTIKEASKKEEDKQLVNELIEKASRSIIKISSHYLFELFPNSIDVEDSRVIFTFRQFLTSQSYSMDIKDISNISIQRSLFFATLQIVSRTYAQNNIMVGHLNPKQAERVQMIIEGLRTFRENNIDTSVYGVQELIAKTEEFSAKKTTQGGENI